MKNTFYSGRYKNTCLSTYDLAYKWVCMNPDIKSGDVIYGKTVLLNVVKMNRCIFYPIKNNITVSECNFIGDSTDLKGELLNQFKLMIYRDDLSLII